MRAFKSLLYALIILGLLAACGPTPTPPSPTATPEAELPLYLAIIWHQHQPLYYKDPQTGIYAKPWVRVHAAKDYYDMAAMLEGYPDIHVTFNLTPSLIKQLDDIAAGAKDKYWVLAEKPASELTEEEKLFILQRFFDTNRRIIKRFPRYQELLDKRGTDLSEEGLRAAMARWTEADFRDLQVLFNLAWTDPDFLAEEPLKSLMEKGRDFSEEDKKVIFDKHLEIVKAVIPKHAELQEKGQIEITMCPYAHPILPLLYATDLAKVAMPDARLPERFSYPQDAIAQIKKGVEFYRAHFGTDPKGMWPAEGAVAQEIVKMVSDAGLLWMASDEEVLAKSIGLEGFTRDSKETVQEADQLYRPYYVAHRNERPVAIVFRDHVLSDKVGFVYSAMKGEEAAQDFLDRLHAIEARLKAQGAEGPHLVTVILDGENAWEWYENDGKEFLHALYGKLSADKTIKTVTPSEYLALYPDQPRIERLWAGSWIGHDFSTWIGEDEENRAWDYLRRTRDMLAQYTLFKRKSAPQETIEKALDLIYAAEGSDWFWWYGTDQNSGDDESFDLMFRSTLIDVYRTMGEEVPDFLYVPIIAKASPPPTRPVQGLLTPQLDGQASDEEWALAGYYEEKGDVIAAMYFGFDAKNVYLRLDAAKPWQEVDFVGIYFSAPRAAEVNSFSRYGVLKTALGFGAAYEAGIWFQDGVPSLSASLARGDNTWEEVPSKASVAAGERVLELAVPWDEIGELEAGDVVSLLAVVSKGGADIATAPAAGPAQVVVPELGEVTVVLEVADPKGDDHGPGSYTYPTDVVFKPGCFDLERFTVGYDERNIVFKFQVYGPVENVWGSPIGLSTQTFDVYIDVDHQPGSGARMLLQARNAAVSEEDAWDYALWIEGWTQGLYKPDAQGKPQKVAAEMKVVVDPAMRRVTVRLPRGIIPGEPEKWGYVAVVLSQEGFSPGRVRDVLPEAEQWRCGGAPDDTNHTRILDLAWPEGATPTQEEILSAYPPSQEKDMDKLSPDDFAQLPMLRVE